MGQIHADRRTRYMLGHARNKMPAGALRPFGSPPLTSKDTLN